MKRFLVGLLCLAVGAAGGYYLGSRTETPEIAKDVPMGITKERPTPTLTQSMSEGDMEFYPIDEVSTLVKNSLPSSAETAKAIQIKWLIDSATILAGKNDTYMHFVVEQLNDKGEWKVLDPKTYRIYAEGFDSNSQFVAAEQFPPGMWP